MVVVHARFQVCYKFDVGTHMHVTSCLWNYVLKYMCTVHNMFFLSNIHSSFSALSPSVYHPFLPPPPSLSLPFPLSLSLSLSLSFFNLNKHFMRGSVQAQCYTYLAITWRTKVQKHSLSLSLSSPPSPSLPYSSSHSLNCFSVSLQVIHDS